MRQGENAGGEGNPVPSDNDAAVVDRVIGKENCFQHFGCSLAIHGQAGFRGFLQIDGLFDGDQRADAHFGKTFDGLDDDFDVLPLLTAGGE